MAALTFNQFLLEGFVNLFSDDVLNRENYKDDVWNILQRSYKSIGGIKGNGFSSKDDMVKNIPFWKVAKSNGKVVAVAMYKDKSGRKLGASGTDGSPEGKTKIIDIVKNDLNRSYGEKSKASLGLFLKLFPKEVIEPFLRTPSEAKKILKKEIIPVKSYTEKLPDDAIRTLKKYPFIEDYGYLRPFADSMMFKVMVGTPNLSIKKR